MAKENDPYAIDPKDIEALEGKAKASFGGGVFCPKRNPALDGDCYVCKAVSQLFNGSEADKDKARRIMAKCTWYANVVFPENPNKVVLLEMGKKAGDDILYGIKKKDGWSSILNPKQNKGRELKITKYRGEGGRNAYSVELALDRADYAIPKETLDNMYNLDNIIELLSTEEIFRVNSNLKMDESLTCRLLPPWDSEKNWPLMFVYRHWGVTEEEVRGEKPIDILTDTPVEVDNMNVNKSSDSPPWENDTPSPDKEEKKEETPSASKQEKKEAKRPPCFGRSVVFEEDSEECLNCPHYKACAKAVAAKKGE